MIITGKLGTICLSRIAARRLHGINLSAIGIAPIAVPDMTMAKMPMIAKREFLTTRVTEGTIARMIQLAKMGARHPQIWLAARQITKGLHAKDYMGEAKRLFNAVRTGGTLGLRWVRDTKNVETLAAPWRTIEAGGGDCDDLSTLLASMLLSIGHDPRFKTIAANPAFPKEFSHVFDQVLISGTWFSMDPSVENAPFGWESPVKFMEKTWPIE